MMKKNVVTIGILLILLSTNFNIFIINAESSKLSSDLIVSHEKKHHGLL